ncbi:hypothetical protein R1sor_022765 [Riccia sorocarpa]|uniref:Uncharacterized protein n=1 Tax=Riccia sorocarpa TaxID=122646 RepID=A0ABD3GQ09_9MARC
MGTARASTLEELPNMNTAADTSEPEPIHSNGAGTSSQAANGAGSSSQAANLGAVVEPVPVRMRGGNSSQANGTGTVGAAKAKA